MSQEYRLKEQPWNNMHVLYVICVLPWDAKVPTLFSCYYKLNGEGGTTIKYLRHNQVTFLHVSYAMTSSPFLVHDMQLTLSAALHKDSGTQTDYDDHAYLGTSASDI